jgi:hypothetical protein
MSVTRERTGIAKIRQLTTELGDRDHKMKNDFHLFEAFFENFPIPVTMWTLTSKGIVVSQRGNGFMTQRASSLEDMFTCSLVKETSLAQHEMALKGNKIDYFIETDNKHYYIKLVPEKNKKDETVGVSGLAWDVTTNIIMLNCLEEIAILSDKKSGQYKEISDIAKKGLGASRLKKMLNEIEIL